MKIRNPWRTAFLVPATVVVTLVVQSALAVVTTNANKGAKKIAVVEAISGVSDTNPATDQDVPGASTSLTVPSSQTGIIVVRFSANSQCNFGAEGNKCNLGVLVDGALSGAVIFDTDDTGDNFFEAHTFQFASDVLGPGPHTVKLQYDTDGGGTSLTIGNGTLTAELWRVS